MVGTNRKYIADFDWLLLAVSILIAAFGVFEISRSEPNPGMWKRQVVGIVIGLAVLFIMTFIDYRRIVNIGPYLYGIGIILLILVLTPLGREVNGNRSWLYFGTFGFQPSELAKITTILFLAFYLSGIRKRPLDLRTIIVAGLIWIVPTILVFMENDTGSGLSFASFFVAMIFLSGVRWKWVAAATVALIITLLIAVPKVKECKTYKCERIKAVYWPELADKKYSYQNEQSEIAVGSGGIYGGLFSGGIFGREGKQSSQGSLGFVPEVHSDFIYAVASEETGFLGSFLSLAAYLLIISRLIQIARRARERVGLLLVGGFGALVLYHVTVNIGMVVRLLPIMGIPLPLMSYGSTSVVATCFGLGLAISVRLKRFVN